ncbi:hypothetical protein SEA_SHEDLOCKHOLMES_63 [Mycobacterium phage ShedlockHolmes]|uniref:Uncharacterized protein n=1 Tax=Mycobacterium phage ShedlockHolmes TaxID=1647313 RepID=A0A0F6WF68_9CAUD|nr:hypothetical protein SEA_SHEDLOCKHOLMES_63 [Mycobacterium phage ShedlockHolmes]AKF15240.1 hypothetical protein SEA_SHEDLOCKHOLMES_63 [Mycobacterium phage ShedlockHolmes]
MPIGAFWRPDVQRSNFAGVSSRWLIRKTGGRWHVRPPVGTFWGRSTQHDTGDQALADFRAQTAHHKGIGARAA